MIAFVIGLKHTLLDVQLGRIEHGRRAMKRIKGQGDALESSELTKLCRHSAGEVVLVQKQLAEFREERETSVKRPRQASR